MTGVDERFFNEFYWEVNRKQEDGSVKTITRTGKVIETRNTDGLESYSIFVKFGTSWQYYCPSDYLEYIEDSIFFEKEGE